MRAPFAPPRLSLPRNVDADAHAVDDQLGDGQSRGEDLRLQRGNVLLADQLMIHSGNGVLPQQRLLREPADRGSARAGPCRDASA